MEGQAQLSFCFSMPLGPYIYYFYRLFWHVIGMYVALSSAVICVYNAIRVA